MHSDMSDWRSRDRQTHLYVLDISVLFRNGYCMEALEYDNTKMSLLASETLRSLPTSFPRNEFVIKVTGDK